MSLSAAFRAYGDDRRPRRDLRLVPVLVAAYAAAWVGDGQATYAALLGWALCGAVGLALLVAGRVRPPAPVVSTSTATSTARSALASVPATAEGWSPIRADDRLWAAATDGLPTDPDADADTDGWPTDPAAVTPTTRHEPRTPTPTPTRAKTRRRTLAAALLIAAGAGTAATTRAIAAHAGPLPRLAAVHAQAAVEAVLTDDPRVLTSVHGPFVVAPVRVERVDGVPTRLPATVLSSRPEAWRLLPSTRVFFLARVRPARPDTPDAAGLSVRRPPEVLAGPTELQRLAGQLRQGLRDACADLPADPRGLLPGLVIGDVSQEPEGLADAFRTTGLSHLTAVSGENLVFVLAAAMPVARLAGVRGGFLTLAGLAVVIGFTVLARPEPSMVRASVMALLSLLLAAVGRRARGLPLLCAGGTLLLLFDPWLARSYGFALSLSATAGLFVLAPRWREALVARGLPLRVAESLACTAAAEACCLPVLVSLTGAITPLAIPANLLAEVCVGPATVLGAAALLGAAVWPALGRAVAWLAQWPTDGIVAVARTGARLPGATVPWPEGLAGAVALLAAGAALVLAVVLISAFAAARKEAR